MLKEKIYVLDTNVLIEDPEVLYKFEKACLGVPITVLEELDSLKVESTSRGANARLITRELDRLRSQGSLRQGVPLAHGGKVKVLFEGQEVENANLKVEVADNKILMTAVYLQKAGHDVVFVSKDINARVKADVLGIPSQDYLRGLVEKDNYYQGWREIVVKGQHMRKLESSFLQDLQAQENFFINEFVLLQSQGNEHNTSLLRYKGDNQFSVVTPPEVQWPIYAKNVYQSMALDLLFDNDIKMVTLTGPAGTGKTFLTLLAGMYNVLVTEEYKKMMVARSVVPLGNDIGFLPGDVQEKLHGWMQPIYDNVDMITHNIAHVKNFMGYGFYDDMPGGGPQGGKGKKGKRRRGPKGPRRSNHFQPEREFRSLDDLIEQRKMSLEAITYMRGRSIPQQFILIDEVQNLSPHEVKTLLSRVGEGTKIVLAGDPYQIDVPYLDFSTNGLIVATDRFKGKDLFGSVFMPTSERSELAKLVQELL